MKWLELLARWYIKEPVGETATNKSQLTDKNDWFYNWLLAGTKSASGIVVSPRRALTDICVMACVSIRSQDLAKLPVHVYRARKDGGQDVIANHPLELLLRKPNAWQTWFEFCEQMQASQLLEGNAYAAIARDGRARPVGLLPLVNATLYVSGTDLYYQPQLSSDFERALFKTFPERISADDMLHVRWLSRDMVRGLSRTALARNAIGLDLALEQAQSQLFSRGAQLAGVLSTEKKLSPEVFDRLKAQWARYEGVDSEKAGSTPLLEEGLKFDKIAMTMVEAQANEARRAQFEQIATAWDVPPHRLGLIPKGGASDILLAHQQYLNNVLSSDAERWEMKLNDLFELDGEQEFVEFDLDYFNRADIKSRLEAARIGVVGSIFRPNEARRYVKLRLADDENGNEIFQPANVVPLGTKPKEPSAPAPAPSGPGSDTTGEPAEGGKGDPAAPPPVED